MKKITLYFCWILSVLALSGCKKSAEQLKEGPETKLMNITDPQDPNLNPNWFWNDPNANYVTVYYLTNGESTVKQLEMTLPWKTQGNPMASQIPSDIKSEDGWVLAFKDFGTPSRGVHMPFFAIYNKYRGILRFFVMNSQKLSASYFIGSLGFRNSSYTNSSLSFFSDRKLTLDYDPLETQDVISYANQFGAWINFDFNIINYDPNVNSNQILDLNIKSVLESELTLNSTEFTLTPQYLSQIRPTYESGANKVLSDGSKFVNGASGLNSALVDSKNLFDKLSNSNNPKDQGVLSKVLSYGETIPVIGKYLGLITAFMGGKKTPLPDQIIKIDGTLKLEGTIKQRLPEYTISISLKKGGEITASYYQPVSDITFGIFGLKKAIPVTGQIYNYIEYNSGPFGTDIEYWGNGTVKLSGSEFIGENFILNPTLSMNLDSIKVNIPEPNPETASYRDFLNKEVTYELVAPSGYQLSPLGNKVGIQCVFKVSNTTFDDEIVFMNTYPIDSQYNFNYFEYNKP